VLESLDFSQTMSTEDYERELQALQLDLVLAQRKLAERGIALICVFEGMDAAGKGGAIKRLTTKLDPRGYQVHPIGPPTEEELKHHYLWRFWDKLPSYGRIAVFDRSWYGRVLVERVEEITPQRRWAVAYDEIVDFERMLVGDEYVLMKFWLHVSEDEQMRRFKEREKDPYRRWKITAEDWRNREKWDAYVAAAEEMFERTSLDHAPWTVVPGEDKQFARVMVLRTVRDAVCERLGDKGGNKSLAPLSRKAQERAPGARSVFEGVPLTELKKNSKPKGKKSSKG
jgi:polyphosphate kinase 2 (PPK2 family)